MTVQPTTPRLIHLNPDTIRQVCADLVNDDNPDKQDLGRYFANSLTKTKERAAQAAGAWLALNKDFHNWLNTSGNQKTNR